MISHTSKIFLASSALAISMMASQAFALDATSTVPTADTTATKTIVQHKKVAKKTKTSKSKKEEATAKVATTASDKTDISATSTKKTSVLSSIGNLLHKKTTTKKAKSTTTTTKVSESNAPVTAICNDGTDSHAQSHEGACSSHGGVKSFTN